MCCPCDKRDWKRGDELTFSRANGDKYKIVFFTAEDSYMLLNLGLGTLCPKKFKTPDLAATYGGDLKPIRCEDNQG